MKTITESRYEDMSNQGQLILEENDESISVTISLDKDSHSFGIEFTTPFMGGGQSINTWRLLSQQFRINNTLEINGKMFKILDDDDGDMYVVFFGVEKKNNKMIIKIDKKWLFTQLDWYLFFDGLRKALRKDNNEMHQIRDF